MRILAISDRYPPFFEGGYEIICREVNQALERRGHEIRVLTTTFGLDKRKTEGEVYRIFDYRHEERNFLRHAKREIENKSLFFNQIKSFRPDLISIWHPTYLSKNLLAAVNSLSVPVVLNLEDHWLLWWYYKRKWKPLKISGVWFVSGCLKAMHQEAGFPVSECPVIYNGLALDKYPLKPKNRDKKSLRLLWAGRIADYKGTHIALEAIRILVRERGITNIKLELAGEADEFCRGYLEELKAYTRKESISHYVSFEGQVRHEDMLQRYLRNDLFLFTSVYKEPFGLCWLEAFACGVPVVGTVTGASKEFFINEENAIVCKVSDPASLASGIKRLSEDDGLYCKIQKNAVDLVKKRFSLETMADKIERLYQAALKREKKFEFSPRKDHKGI